MGESEIFLCILMLFLVALLVFYITQQPPSEKPPFIPLIIHQTYYNKKKIPQKVFDNIQQYAPEFEYRFYDDFACMRFLANHFDQRTMNSFSILSGAHRADLFRYAVLYIVGGVYLDIKTELVTPLLSLCQKNTSIVTCLDKDRSRVYQGFIAAQARHPIFLSLIEFIIRFSPPDYYHVYTQDFYNKLFYWSGQMPTEGIFENKVFLYQEECTSEPSDCYDGLDRHGLCCHITSSGQKIIKTRYADYPW